MTFFTSWIMFVDTNGVLDVLINGKLIPKTKYSKMLGTFSDNLLKFHQHAMTIYIKWISLTKDKETFFRPYKAFCLSIINLDPELGFFRKLTPPWQNYGLAWCNTIRSDLKSIWRIPYTGTCISQLLVLIIYLVWTISKIWHSSYLWANRSGLICLPILD